MMLPAVAHRNELDDAQKPTGSRSHQAFADGDRAVSRRVERDVDCEAIASES